MSDEELLESLDRHFMAGCPELSTAQLHEHQATGSCPECRDRAGHLARADRVITDSAARSPR